MIRVVRDAAHPGMWRVRWPDGRLSDLVNLSRAKDAVEERGGGTAHSPERRPPTQGTPSPRRSPRGSYGELGSAGGRGAQPERHGARV
jgi:hypothetical protein